MKYVLAALVGSLVLAAPAAAQSVTTVDRSTPIAAYAGRLLWSTFDPSTQTYGLVTRVGGVTSAVPVPPRILADPAALAAFIDFRLLVRLGTAENDVLLNGDGADDPARAVTPAATLAQTDASSSSTC